MESFSVTVGVGHFDGGKLEDLTEVSLTVEAEPRHGPGYAMLPKSLLNALGIRPVRKQPIEFVSGKIEMCDIGAAWIAYNDEKMVCPVIFGSEGEYLLGFLTPGFLSLKVDPIGKRLVPADLVIYSVY